MRLASLLLCALSLSLPLAARDAAPPDSQQLQIDTNVVWSFDQDAQAFAMMMPQADSGDDVDGICYKIRAYIFKRDADDHTPQLKGSTTCVPGPPRAKNIVWPKPRLVPAD